MCQVVKFHQHGSFKYCAISLFVDLELDAEAMQDLGSAEVVRKSIPLKLKKPKLKVKSSKSSKSKKEKKSSSTSEHKESSEGLIF